LDALDGESQDALDRPLLLTMTAAARLAGMGRTWFWEQVRADQNRATKLFPPVEVSPGVFRYRRKDVEVFASRTATYAPRRLETKIPWR